MFGKRASFGGAAAPKPTQTTQPAEAMATPAAAPSASSAPLTSQAVPPPPAPEARRSDDYYITKSMIFGALIEAIDLSQLSKLDPENAREEIRDIVNEIISIKNVVMSISEQEDLLEDICNDVLGYGPPHESPHFPWTHNGLI